MASTLSQKNLDAAVEKALVSERTRTAELTALGSKFGFSEDAEKFIDEGKSVADFQAHVLSKSPNDWSAALATKGPEEQTKEACDAVAEIKERRRNAASNR